MFPKNGALATYYKATSYVCSSTAPVVNSTIKPKSPPIDIPFIPFTSIGYSRILSTNLLKVISGISGKTQYRYSHTDLQIPDYSNVRKNISKDPTRRAADTANQRKAFQYLVTTLSLTSAAYLSKEFLTKSMLYFHYNQDAYAVESVVIDISVVPEGKSVTFKWQGKPVFVKHRTADEIERAREVAVAELRHPETDDVRVQKPEWLITLGICTHLGCIPLPNKGDYPGGYFCPCHGSHYDTSGRIRKGPAPENLEIPPYSFIDDAVIRVG